MTDGPTRPPHPHRPTLFGKQALESMPAGPDPADVAEVAHSTARLLVDAGRGSDDPDDVRRLVGLVDEHGLDTVAELWADRPARSLPGALWRLYVLREWVRRDAWEAAEQFRAGQHVVPVSQVVAGTADPPTPESVRDTADAILTGVFRGDLAVALERAGAFARVVAVGRAHRAESISPADSPAASRLVRQSANLVDTAGDLEACAALWRAGRLW